MVQYKLMGIGYAWLIGNIFAAAAYVFVVWMSRKKVV
jgi:hypothetical protein